MIDVDRHIPVAITFPPKLEPFWTTPAKFKVAYGGRGAAKSWTIARMLLLKGAQTPLRILCARETMTSIADSVHQLLADQIENLHLGHIYKVERDAIKGVNGTLFRFAGIRRDINQIKSFEGIDVAWIEEAANCTRRSWQVFIPTVRKKGSEIWVSFNPDYESDDTYQRFVVRPPENSIVVKINWQDNPWLESDTDLIGQIEESREHDPPELYQHVWEGQCRQYLDGAVYAREVADAERDDQDGGSRFRSVPYDPAGGEVQAFWDIGIADATAIWVAQRVGGAIHIIDHLEDYGHPADWYLRQLARRNVENDAGYIIKRHWLPHDARARSFATGVTAEEVIRKSVPAVSIVPRVSLADGIGAVRMMFKAMWFDKRRCADGLRAIRNYKFETIKKIDPHTGMPSGGFKQVPEHSEWSHSADALRYLALSLRPPRVQSEADDGANGKYLDFLGRYSRSNTSWMNCY